MELWGRANTHRGPTPTRAAALWRRCCLPAGGRCCLLAALLSPGRRQPPAGGCRHSHAAPVPPSHVSSSHVCFVVFPPDILLLCWSGCPLPARCATLSHSFVAATRGGGGAGTCARVRPSRSGAQPQLLLGALPGCICRLMLCIPPLKKLRSPDPDLQTWCCLWVLHPCVASSIQQPCLGPACQARELPQ